MTGVRVLVADDDPDYLRLMSGHLRKRGYQVEAVDGGRAALEALQHAEAFAVLVTDLMMPGMDGYELLRRARTQDAFIEVIVISGVGSLESAISSMRENGAYDYLTKPLEKVTDLSLAVERAVAHRQLRLERAQLQAQIQAERERLTSLLTNTSDAILSADSSGVVAVANPQASRLLKIEHLVGQRASVVLPAPLLILLEHWKGASPDRAMVSEVPWPAEQVHLISLTPLNGGIREDGVGWVMVLQDITHLKQIDALKMRLLTETAENIRGPLAAAFTSLMALNDLPEARTEGFTARMDNLVAQLSAIRKWADDLLEIFTIEGGASLQPEPVRLGELARSWDNSQAGHDLRQRGLSLHLRVERELPPVLADRRLAQALMDNLIAQAVWRSPEGGAIGLDLRYAQGQVWIDVRDQGSPIDAADAVHLFERAYSDPASSRATSGLELAMVKTMVDRIGGQVWFSGQNVGGNVLSISFPPLDA